MKKEKVVQEKIKYIDIIDAGFEVDEQSDDVYFMEHGFSYDIISRELTKKIYLDWEKDTKLCKMIRIDGQKHCNIMAEMPVRDLGHLKELIDFFTDDKTEFNHTTVA